MMKTGKNNRFLASILAASMLLAMSPFALAEGPEDTTGQGQTVEGGGTNEGNTTDTTTGSGTEGSGTTTGDHRFRFDGRAHQVLCILHLLDDYFCGHLPGFRSLDLGRRLARRAWLP